MDSEHSQYIQYKKLVQKQDKSICHDNGNLYEVYIRKPKLKTKLCYNSEKNIAILYLDSLPVLSLMIDSIRKKFQSVIYIWIAIELDCPAFYDSLEILRKNGFSFPHLTIRNPSLAPLPMSIAVVRSYKNPKESPESIFYGKIESLIYAKEKDTCKIHISFLSKAVSYLESLVHTDRNENGDGQVEIGGNLFIRGIVKKKDTLIYQIDVDTKSIQKGENEGVSIDNNRYNFHTHPYEAYVRNEVDKAWPSETDFVSFKRFGDRNIFHCVSTIEGLYIISWSKDWRGNKDSIPDSFILKNFDIDQEDESDIHNFCKRINSVKYTNNRTILNVQYLPWKDATKVITVYFSKSKGGCVSDDEDYVVSEYTSD